MKNLVNRKKIVIISLIGILMLSVIIVNFLGNKNESKLKETMRENLTNINALCNEVISDIEKNEKKYIELLKTEDDYLKRGMYSSAMSQIYTVKGELDGIIKYGKDAMENYKKVAGGEYLAISECKYLAWSMLRIGRYGESFTFANETLNILQLYSGEVLTDEEIIETEALIYSIFNIIYSEFGLMDNAKFYNDKLEAVKKSEGFDNRVGERVYYSQMFYSEKIKDYKQMKKYAERCYNIALKNDTYNDGDMADASILNLAISNIALGNIDEGFEQLKKSEAFFEKVGDTHTLGAVCLAYARGYEGINQIDKSIEYYKKTLNIYNEFNDKFRIKVVLEEFLNMLEKYKNEDELTKAYKYSYTLERELKENSEINKLLEESLAINDKMSKNRIDSVLREKNFIEKRNYGFLLVILTLVIMCYWIWRLYEKKRRSEKELEKVVNCDYLTGANTRDYGFKEVSKLIKSKANFSLAMIDIDNFKHINDTYGHLLGDEVLKTVAMKIRERIGEEHLLIRFGGEEFIIIFKNLNKDEGKFILDEVREEVKKISFNGEVNVSFSGGIDEFKNDDINETIGIVDKLLYIAKNNGKNQVVLG